MTLKEVMKATHLLGDNGCKYIRMLLAFNSGGDNLYVTNNPRLVTCTYCKEGWGYIEEMIEKKQRGDTMKLLQLLTFVTATILSVTASAQWQEPTDPVIFTNLRCDGVSSNNLTKRLIINANTSNGGHAVHWERNDPNNAQVRDLTHWVSMGLGGVAYFVPNDPSHFYFVFSTNQVWYYYEGMNEGQYDCALNSNPNNTATTTSLKKAKK